MSNFQSDDRPEPSEQPIRARVPEHVSSGAFSTGVIVMTANSEFILDFVQNLGRPHQITARVVMPHYVLPQLVDALHRNIELYRNRWGELPQIAMPAPAQLPWSAAEQTPAKSPAPGTGASGAAASGSGTSGPGATSSGSQTGMSAEGADSAHASRKESSGASEAPGPSGPYQADINVRHPTAQDIYDDLKIRDELLSGAYANAVMIGHGPHEFSFDFITNFYPHSSVSARVFMAAGQVPRFYESLKGTWDQLRARNQSRGNRPGGPPGSNRPPDQGPDAQKDEGPLG